MELMEKGSLAAQYKQQQLDYDDIVAVLKQILSALAYLHNESFIHRDVKLENILVSSRSPWLVKLGDFGLTDRQSSAKGKCGTLMYRAPEMFQRPSYDTAIDMWSLGVTILLLLWGARIYSACQYCPDSETCNEIFRLGERLSPRGTTATNGPRVTHRSPRKMIHAFVMDSMLKIEPEDRLSAKRCLELITEGYLSEVVDVSPAVGASRVSTRELEKVIPMPAELYPNTRGEASRHMNARDSSEANTEILHFGSHPLVSKLAQPSMPEQREAKRMKVARQVDEERQLSGSPAGPSAAPAPVQPAPAQLTPAPVQPGPAPVQPAPAAVLPPAAFIPAATATPAVAPRATNRGGRATAASSKRVTRSQVRNNGLTLYSGLGPNTRL